MKYGSNGQHIFYVHFLANAFIDVNYRSLADEMNDEAIMVEANMAAINLLNKVKNKCDSNECDEFQTFVDVATSKILCPNPLNRVVSNSFVWIFVGICATLCAIIMIVYRMQAHGRQSDTKPSAEGYQLDNSPGETKSIVKPVDIQSGAFCLATTTMTVSLLSRPQSRAQSQAQSRAQSPIEN